MKLLYNAKGGKIEWLEKEKIVVKTVHGYIHGEELRTVFNAGYEQMKKSRGKKWLTDNQGMRLYEPEDAEWINKDWLPRMLKAGWEYWALVEPDSNVGLLTMEKFKFYARMGIDLHKFRNVEQALSWLISADRPVQKHVRSEYRGIDLGSPALIY